jgi:hypothetical protein
VRSSLDLKRTKLRPPPPPKRLPRRDNPPGSPARPRPNQAARTRPSNAKSQWDRPHRYELIPDTTTQSAPKNLSWPSIDRVDGRPPHMPRQRGHLRDRVPAPHPYQRARSPRVRNYLVRVDEPRVPPPRHRPRSSREPAAAARISRLFAFGPPARVRPGTLLLGCIAASPTARSPLWQSTSPGRVWRTRQTSPYVARNIWRQPTTAIRECGRQNA